MQGIIGKKIGMSALYQNGVRVPVSLILAGPCTVLQKKPSPKNGKSVYLVGFEEKLEKRTRKPEIGLFKKVQVKPLAFLKEFKSESEYQIGQQYDVSIFENEKMVKVTGISKGRGFIGAVKRFNKTIGPQSHGNTTKRAPGSLGNRSFPGWVFKGKPLPGHMGDVQVTIQHLKVMRVNKEKNLLALEGSVPGANQGIVYIYKNTINKN